MLFVDTGRKPIAAVHLYYYMASIHSHDYGHHPLLGKSNSQRLPLLGMYIKNELQLDSKNTRRGDVPERLCKRLRKRLWRFICFVHPSMLDQGLFRTTTNRFFQTTSRAVDTSRKFHLRMLFLEISEDPKAYNIIYVIRIACACVRNIGFYL